MENMFYLCVIMMSTICMYTTVTIHRCSPYQRTHRMLETFARFEMENFEIKKWLASFGSEIRELLNMSMSSAADISYLRNDNEIMSGTLREQDLKIDQNQAHISLLEYKIEQTAAHIYHMEHKMSATNRSLLDQETSNDVCKAYIKQLESKVTNLTKTLQEYDAEILDLKTNFTWLAGEIFKLKHEHGATIFIATTPTDITTPATAEIKSSSETNSIKVSSETAVESASTVLPNSSHLSNFTRGHVTEVSQWASAVLNVSSQYSETRWSAEQVIGPPDVYPYYRDDDNAWTQLFGHLDNKQFVELKYDQAVYISSINIYETYHSGGVSAIKVRNSEGKWITVWNTNFVQALGIARIFSPFIQTSTFLSDNIRIEVDCTVAKGYVEIDAVQVIGTTTYKSQAHLMKQPGESAVVSQWVSSILNVSSQYGAIRWAATQVIGPPDVYPRYGEHSHAWAQLYSRLDREQFLEVKFDQAVYIISVSIYETFHSGGVRAIKARNQGGLWITLWSTPSVQNLGYSRIFSPVIRTPNFTSDSIRIEVNCSVSGNFVEIDAVQLTGTFTARSPPPSMSQNDANANSDLGELRQWVSEVSHFSSQYNKISLGAVQLIGTPDVYPYYDDLPGSWTQHPSSRDSKQFVELKYNRSVYITSVDIYETYHSGGVKAIKALNSLGKWTSLWSTNYVQVIAYSRIFSPVLQKQIFNGGDVYKNNNNSQQNVFIVQKVDFMTSMVRIEVDCTVANNHVNIDAVEVTGTQNASSYDISFKTAATYSGSQWVSGIRNVSSQYGTISSSATQLIGPPDVYPYYGDSKLAWVQHSSSLDSEQFIELKYDYAVYITSVDIYETYHSGGVKAVKALNPDNQWVTLWSTTTVQNIGYSRVFSPNLQTYNFTSDSIRIEVDCSVAKKYVEIDAVALIGTNSYTDIG